MADAQNHNTQGLFDFVDYIRKFRDFKQRFTDADGITLADVTELVQYLSTVLGLEVESAALLELVEAVKTMKFSAILDKGSALLDLIAKRVKVNEERGVNPFQEIKLTSGPGQTNALADACGAIADGLEAEQAKVKALPPEQQQTEGAFGVIAITVIGQLISAWLKKRWGLNK